MRILSLCAFCVFMTAASEVANGQKAGVSRDDPLPRLAEFQVRTYSDIDGLTDETVMALAQTPDGFLYAGTGHGLFRFDSRGFERVPLPGFASTLIEDLFVDRRGRLWVRSTTADIAYVENGTVHVLGRLRIPAYGFTSLADGTVWLSGEQGLVRLTAETPEWFKIFTRADGLPSDTVAGLYQMKNGELIVATDGGLSRLVGNPRATGGLRFDEVWSGRQAVNWGFVRNDANGFWVTDAVTGHTIRYHDGIVTSVGPQGLSIDDLSWRPGDETALRANFASYLRDPDDWARASVISPGRHIGRGLLQRDGTRWLDLRRTTRHSELLRLPPSGKPELIDLSGHPEWSMITALIEDHEGSIWIGTDRGLLQLVKRRVRAVAQGEGLPRELALPVLQTRDGAVWVGTWGDGLFRFAHGALAERLTPAQGLPDDRIRSLFESADGALWVGMRNALARMVRGRVVEQFAVDNEVRAIAETPDHVLWIAGAREIVIRKPEGQISRMSRTDRSIGPAWSIFAEPNGSALVGTQRGLFRVTPDLTAPTRVGASQGLDETWVTGVFAEQDGTLWIGTYDRGVFRLRATGLDHIGASAGLPLSAVSLLDDRHGGIWLSGSDGLWRVSRDSLHMVADDIAQGRVPRTLRPVPFRESEGAPGREGERASPAGWRLGDGRLVFNNSSGLSVIDLADTSTSRISPRTVVLSVGADGQRVATADGHAIVPPQTRRVEIEFATLSFLAPRQHRFRYRLDGFDADWTEVGAQARTSYTNLHPGRYTFRVRPVRPPGTAWVDSEATQVIEIQASWWQTRWFQLVSAVGLCLAVYGLHRLRLRQAMAIHRVRATIASDLHDDLGSSINAIALMTQLLETDAELGGTTRHLLSRIQRATEETALSVRQLVWLVDPAHTNLDFLLLRLQRTASDLLPDTQVEFDVGPLMRSRSIGMTIMRNLLLVFKEALNNVARHAKATRVDISILEQRGALEMTIRDNGAGFDATRVEYGNGLRNMRSRVQGLGGDLTVDSVAGRGTTIVVTMKLS